MERTSVFVCAAALSPASCSDSRQHPDLANSVRPAQWSKDDLSPPPKFCTEVPTTPVTVASVEPLITDPAQGLVISDLVVAPDSSIYIVDDKLPQITKYDRNGKALLQFGKRGPGPGEFREPRSVAVGRNGDMHVVDNKFIHSFDRDARYLKTNRLPISEARSIVLDETGDFVVARWVFTNARNPQRYVVAIDAATMAPRTITTFTASQLGERPFIAPIYNNVTLTGGVDGRVAILVLVRSLSPDRG